MSVLVECFVAGAWTAGCCVLSGLGSALLCYALVWRRMRL